MTAKQWKMKQAGHIDTPSGLDAAWKRGVQLAKNGGSELDANEAAARCKTADSRKMLLDGYAAELARIYKLNTPR